MKGKDLAKEATFQLGLLKEEPPPIKLPKPKVRQKKPLSLNLVVDPVTWVTDGTYTAKQMKLFDDVSQIYELLLARMEFSSFSNELDLFLKRTAYFEEIGSYKTNHYYLSSVRGKWQIGHSNQYLTHWFYPYKGKYHGQMIKALINFMGVKEDGLILDPFVGSGTTLIECATLGIPIIELNFSWGGYG